MRLKKKRKKKKSSPTTQFGIFDRGSLKHIDALQVALLRAGKDTLLPEIYDIFGKDKLLKFLDIFAGTTVVVPTKKVVEDSIRDTYIYLGMEKAKAQRKEMADVVRDLALRYDIDNRDVHTIYEDMKKHF
jgi:hypothetical protein